MKRTSLRSNATLKSGKRLRLIGQKKRKEIEETSDFRAEYRRLHPICEIGYVLRVNRIQGWENCRQKIDGTHERVKRSGNGSLVDPDNLMSACSFCNGWIEYNHPLAKELGLELHSTQDPAEVPVQRMRDD